jgi:hypothetical protein
MSEDKSYYGTMEFKVVKGEGVILTHINDSTFVDLYKVSNDENKKVYYYTDENYDNLGCNGIFASKALIDEDYQQKIISLFKKYENIVPQDLLLESVEDFKLANKVKANWERIK